MEFLQPVTEPGAAEAWAARVRAHWQQHGFGQWVVEIPGEAGLIGVVGLSTVSYEAHFTPAVEVAWRLARAHWGCGYATEAARAAVDYGFDTLGLTEIVAITVPANLRSRRVMERLGMTPGAGRRFRPPRRSGRAAEALRPLPPASPGRDAVTILLVRHGETEWNRERRYQGRFDLPLTERGVAQARAIGRLFAALPDAAAASIVASPQGRARRTAKIIREELSAPGELQPGRSAARAVARLLGRA